MPARTLPRTSLSSALLPALLLLAACPPEGGTPEGATAQPDGSSGSTGSTGTSEDPTTGDAPTSGDDATTGAPEGTSTGAPDGSSSGDATTTDSIPVWCPYDLPGVDIDLERTVQDVAADLGARPCGAADSGHWRVDAGDPAHLALTACADAGCGACDPADTLALDLTIPPAFPGLPPGLDAGECLRLDLEWDKASDDPAACRVSSLVLVRTDGGLAEPVPRFMYHHSGSLPAGDHVGGFTLTGEAAPPGEVQCPCDGDCCELQPGSLPVAFTAAREGLGEVGLLPLEPGLSLPAFEIQPIEGDTLAAAVHLVRSTVPSACDVPSQHEWLLRVVTLP